MVHISNWFLQFSVATLFTITNVLIIIIIIIIKNHSHQRHHSTVSWQLLCQPDSHFLTTVTKPFKCSRKQLACLSPDRLISNECRLLIALLSRSVCRLYRAAQRCVSCTELHSGVCSTLYSWCKRFCVRPKPKQRKLTLGRPCSFMWVYSSTRS